MPISDETVAHLKRFISPSRPFAPKPTTSSAKERPKFPMKPPKQAKPPMERRPSKKNRKLPPKTLTQLREDPIEPIEVSRNPSTANEDEDSDVEIDIESIPEDELKRDDKTSDVGLVSSSVDSNKEKTIVEELDSDEDEELLAIATKKKTSSQSSMVPKVKNTTYESKTTQIDRDLADKVIQTDGHKPVLMSTSVQCEPRKTEYQTVGVQTDGQVDEMPSALTSLICEQSKDCCDRILEAIPSMIKSEIECLKISIKDMIGKLALTANYQPMVNIGPKIAEKTEKLEEKMPEKINVIEPKVKSQDSNAAKTSEDVPVITEKAVEPKKKKARKPKVYISSDDEEEAPVSSKKKNGLKSTKEEEKTKAEEEEAKKDTNEKDSKENEEVIEEKPKTRTGRQPRLPKRLSQESTGESSSSVKPRLSGQRKSTAAGKQKKQKELDEDSEECQERDTEAIEEEKKAEEDEPMVVEPTPRSKRGVVAKKRVAAKELAEDKEEPKSKKAAKVGESSVKPKPAYKPRPKSKQRQVMEEQKKAEEEEEDDDEKDKDYEEVIEELPPKTISKVMTKRTSRKSIAPPKTPEKELFKRPPVPSPARSTSSSSSSSSRLRTSSNERPLMEKKVILCSGLTDVQKRKLENVCHELDAELTNEYSDRVTHLVISLADGRPKKDMICPRNAKYLKALLGNKWIVTFDWITDSLKSNRWIEEHKYEIKADKSATERNLPEDSRSSGRKLFAKQMVLFMGDFGELLPDLIEMVEVGGGIVVDSIEEFESRKRKEGIKKLIVVSVATGLPSTQADGVKYVTKQVFMQSLSNFQEI